jgi:quercetin dioxygenase-like cupin family protein
MEPLNRIAKGNSVYAMFFCGGVPVEGPWFPTAQEDELQVGVMERPAGYEVKAHRHPVIPRKVQGMCEFLYIESGKVRVQVYDEEWNVIGEQELGSGDFLLFLRGGHGLTMLEPTRMIEVKQGPYMGEAKNKEFRPI